MPDLVMSTAMVLYHRFYVYVHTTSHTHIRTETWLHTTSHIRTETQFSFFKMAPKVMI